MNPDPYYCKRAEDQMPKSLYFCMSQCPDCAEAERRAFAAKCERQSVSSLERVCGDCKTRWRAPVKMCPNCGKEASV